MGSFCSEILGKIWPKKEKAVYRSSRPEVFLRKDVLNGCSPVNLLHIFRIPFPKNTSGRLLLNFNCSGKVLLLIEWLILTKKNSEKVSAFYLMILVGISRSWEAYEISSSRVTFLIFSRLTFPKENLQPEFSSFILRMLGCFKSFDRI